jgi:hypothetical protein
MRTHPAFIALANALIPGTGYLIIQERIVFGSLLLAGNIALLVLMAVEPSVAPAGFLQSESGFGMGIELLWYGLFAAAFAYDGYVIAKEKRALTAPSPVPEAH